MHGRMYSIAGVPDPERLATDPPRDNCDRLRLSQGVVFHVSLLRGV